MKAEKRIHILYYKAAGGVLVDQTGTHVLLLIRPSRDEVRLPKGHIEQGETLQEAAMREVREESGYGDIIILKTLGEQLVAFQYNGHQIQRTEYYYLMRAQSRQQHPRPGVDENQFFATWVEWDQAAEALTFEAEREWLRRARSALDQI